MKKRDLVDYGARLGPAGQLPVNVVTERECPQCGSKRGQPCTSVKGRRCAPHRARMEPAPVKRRRRAAEQYEPADLFAGLDNAEPGEGGES